MKSPRLRYQHIWCLVQTCCLVHKLLPSPWGLHGGRSEEVLWNLRALIPFMRSRPLFYNQALQAPPPNTATLEIRLYHMTFAETCAFSVCLTCKSLWHNYKENKEQATYCNSHWFLKLVFIHFAKRKIPMKILSNKESIIIDFKLFKTKGNKEFFKAWKILKKITRQFNNYKMPQTNWKSSSMFSYESCTCHRATSYLTYLAVINYYN